MFTLGSDILVAEIQCEELQLSGSTSEKRHKRFSHQQVSEGSSELSSHQKINFVLGFYCYPYIKQNIWHWPDTSVETLFILYTVLEMRYKQIEFVLENRNQVIKRVKGDSKPDYIRSVEENQDILLGVEKIQREQDSCL